jgi:hypothetical protein
MLQPHSKSAKRRDYPSHDGDHTKELLVTHTPPQRAVGSGAVPTRLELTLLSLLPVAAGCVAVVESLGSTEILVGAGRGLAVVALVLGFLFGIHVRSSGVTNRAHLLWVLANVASGIALQFVGEARTGVSTLSIAGFYPLSSRVPRNVSHLIQTSKTRYTMSNEPAENRRRGCSDGYRRVQKCML